MAEPNEVKKAKISAPKYADMPEIEEYERPELEKYEKPEFEKTEKPKKVRTKRFQSHHILLLDAITSLNLNWNDEEKYRWCIFDIALASGCPAPVSFSSSWFRVAFKRFWFVSLKFWNFVGNHNKIP